MRYAALCITLCVLFLILNGCTEEEKDDTSESVNLNSGLVAYYPFSGNANDQSGNGHHGTVNGATLTADRQSSSDQAYSFDGTNDYIEVPDNDQLDGMTSGLSLAAWLKTSSTQSQIVLSKAKCCGTITDDSYTLGFKLLSSSAFPSQVDGAVQGVLGDSRQLDWDSAYVAGSSKVVTDGNWHHVAFIWDKPNLKIYVDGQEDSNLVYYDNKSTNSESLNSVTASLSIGANYNKDSGNYTVFFSGSIDEVRIYNRALNASEVSQLY